MKLITKHLKKSIINVHFLTFLYLILSFVENSLGIYLCSLLIVLVHEMMHYLTAKYFYFDVGKITVLPFGAFLQINDLYFHDIKEELCVVMAGPASHLFMHYIIIYFFDGYNEEYLLVFNAFIFFFNLLPIYPMDGHRIISLLLQKIYDFKKSLYISLKISVFSLCLLFICYYEMETIVILLYLLQSQIYYFKEIPNILRHYFSHIDDSYKNEKKIIHTNYNYRRGYDNFYLINNKLSHERQVVYELLKTIKNI